MRIKRTNPHKNEVYTGSLNDILFILLLFFLIVATIANPDVIKVNNPTGKSDQRVKQNLVVTVDSLQNFYIGPNPSSIDSLEVKLQKELALQSDTIKTVVINADKKANVASVVKVMQLAKKLNAQSVLGLSNQ